MALYIWERQARPVMDAIAAPDAGPARAVVMGNAGSGKSTVLRELHRLLADQSTHVSLLTDATDVSRVPHSHVLLVDDLHLLGIDQVESLRARSEDPNASLVVASRPWPRVDALTGITRSLERSRPAIVLGPRVALGRADLPQRRRPVHLELVRRSRARVHRWSVVARLRGPRAARRARLRRRRRSPRRHAGRRRADRPPPRHHSRPAAARDRAALREFRSARPSPHRSTTT